VITIENFKVLNIAYLTPKLAEVLAAHLAICLVLFSALASSPCCLVPIFKSSIQGWLKCEVIFSSIRKYCLFELSDWEMLLITSFGLPVWCILILQIRYGWKAAL